MCKVIQIPKTFEELAEDHDIWSHIQIDLNETNRKRALRFMAGAGAIEQLVAARNEEALDAHKPAKWNV